MGTQKRFPAVSEELLAELDRLFPNRVPRITDTGREVWAAVGARRVIDKLRHEHEQQVNRSMEAR